MGEEISVRLSRLETDVALLKSDVASLKANMASLKKDVELLRERMAKVEDIVDTIRWSMWLGFTLLALLISLLKFV